MVLDIRRDSSHNADPGWLRRTGNTNLACKTTGFGAISSSHEGSHTTNEMMTVAASRELEDGAVCFVGIELPSQAAKE